jgi:hypothetical protein
MGTTPATVAPSNAYARYQGSTHRRQEYSPGCAGAPFDRGDAAEIPFGINGPMTALLGFVLWKYRMALLLRFKYFRSNIQMLL